MEHEQMFEFTVRESGKNLEEARLRLSSAGVFGHTYTDKVAMRSVGYPHSDGVVRTCAPAPEGFILFDILPKRPERHECWFAIPASSEYVLTDYHYHKPLPSGTLIWKRDEWRPMYE